jgi:hypothetical protein
MLVGRTWDRIWMGPLLISGTGGTEKGPVLNGKTTHVHSGKNVELRSGLPDYLSGIPNQAFFTEYRSHIIPVPITSL